MGDLPPKLFFRIGEVAGLVGVEPHVLRYWEREFRSIRPTKSAKGQRVYSRKDVENLLRVRDLLYRDGFTIAGAKKKLQRAPADELMREQARFQVEPQQKEMTNGASQLVASHHADPFQGSLARNHHISSPRIVEKEVDDHDFVESDEEAVTESSPLHAVAVVVESPTTDTTEPSSQSVREKLVELRSEVESFLLELSPTKHQ